MYALAEALGIPLPYAVGLLEMLWHHAAQHTPQGDIGSLPDIAIAQGCAFSRKPRILIDALVECGWVDTDPNYRLVIHDWPDHCEQSVKKHLDYWEKTFLPVYGISPQNSCEIGDNSPPSREAVAMAEATAVARAKKKNVEAYPEQSSDFEVFWRRYWRKIAKQSAAESFRKLVISKDVFGLVLTSIDIQAPLMLARDPDKRPHASTWLNQRRWEDEMAGELESPPSSRAMTLEEKAAL